MQSGSFILRQLLTVIQHQRSAVRDVDLDLLEELVTERRRIVGEAGLLPATGEEREGDSHDAREAVRRGWENLARIQSMDLLLKDELDELILRQRRALKVLASHSLARPGE